MLEHCGQTEGVQLQERSTSSLVQQRLCICLMLFVYSNSFSTDTCCHYVHSTTMLSYAVLRTSIGELNLSAALTCHCVHWC
jgi:hypothetical protein